jgi:hypothetical protein
MTRRLAAVNCEYEVPMGATPYAMRGVALHP